MSYYGEKGKFSFRDNFCEEIAESDIGEIADFGSVLGSVFKRVALGTDNPSKYSELYALAGGISKSGADVFIINDVMPVFRYGINSVDCQCGVYLSGGAKLRVLFFDKYGISAENDVKNIYECNKNIKSEKNGKISQVLHIGDLYFNSIKDCMGSNFSESAVISCGNSRIAKIWRKFFTSEKGDVIFQVSEDGERVNCYNTELGFISYERLLLAYAVLLWEKGEKVILPHKFHYAGERLADDLKAEYEYHNSQNSRKVFEQRFTLDTLYLCVQLMNCGKPLAEVMRKLPKFYTAKREIFSDFAMNESERTVISSNGHVNIAKSGKNRLTLTVQSMDAETAGELCGSWEKLILNSKNIRNCSKKMFS